MPLLRTLEGRASLIVAVVGLMLPTLGCGGSGSAAGAADKAASAAPASTAATTPAPNPAEAARLKLIEDCRLNGCIAFVDCL